MDLGHASRYQETPPLRSAAALEKRAGIMADIVILVGTESGNAQMVADVLKDELEGHGHAVSVTDRALSEADFAKHEVALICCSTHGNGDIPSNILPLVEHLERGKPDLSALRYGVIALGDQTYSETFCFGGKKLDAAFAACGARKLGERLEIDACTQPLPDEEALQWSREWAGLL
jgi:MioC protein